MHRTFFVVALATILIVGIAIGWTAHRLLVEREAGPDVGRARPSPVVASSPAAVPSLVVATPVLVVATPTLVPREVVVEVTEGQLEQQLNALLVGQALGSTPLGPATVQSVTVQLRDRLVRVGGNAKAGLLTAPFEGTGTVVPDSNGRPQVQVSQVSVGGIELPGAARQALAASLQDRVDNLISDRSVKVRTIEIADGRMRVVGTGGS